MIAPQLSAIKIQFIETVSRYQQNLAELTHNIHSSQLGTKNRSKGLAFQQPSHYLVVIANTSEKTCNIIEHSWSTIEVSQLDLQIQNREGLG